MIESKENGVMQEIMPILDAISKRDGIKKVEIEQISSTPSTEYYQIRLLHDRKREENYLVKKFKKRKKEELTNFFQSELGDVQDTENEILFRYKEVGKEIGCNVPSPCGKIKSDILILQMIEGDTLEKKLLENYTNEGKRESLIEKVSVCLSDFHHAGRKIQGSILTSDKTTSEAALNIINNADLMKRAEYYFVALAADESELKKIGESDIKIGKFVSDVKEKCKNNFSKFNALFEIISRHFLNKETQLIHGDMTTYHIIFDKNGKPWIIDLGKPKFSNVVFDLCPLYFSQDTNLKIDAIKDIFPKYLERENFNLTGRQEEVNRERRVDGFKSLLYGGIFSNIRRGSKNKFLRLVYPAEYVDYIKNHISYSASLPFYKTSTREIIEYILKNKEKINIVREDYNTMFNFLKLIDKFLSDGDYRNSNIRKDIFNRTTRRDYKKSDFRNPFDITNKDVKKSEATT